MQEKDGQVKVWSVSAQVIRLVRLATRENRRNNRSGPTFLKSGPP